jgi:hypothetical protein
MSDTLTPEAHDFVTHALEDYYSGRRDEFRKETENIDWFGKDQRALEDARMQHKATQRVEAIRKALHGKGAFA